MRKLPGWVLASGTFEIQKGDIAGLTAFDGESKLELDSRRNSSVYSTIKTSPGQSYLLSFYYSPRVEQKNTNTNNIAVYWGGKKITTLSGDRKGWVKYEFEVPVNSAKTRLQLTAKGRSDSYGGFIDDVRVVQVVKPEPPVSCSIGNLLTNASFEDFDGSLKQGNWDWVKNIPGWKANRGYMEIQTGNVAGLSAQDGVAKLELDSKHNSRAFQVVTLPKEKSDYILTLHYSPRITNNRATNLIKVVWNNKVIATLGGTEKVWKEYRYDVVSRKSGQNRLELRAAGKSDSYGGLLDNLKLVSKACDTAVNQAPEAQPLSVTTDENTAVDIAVVATDPDGDALSYSVVSAPEHGNLSGTGPEFTYTPDTNYFGTDSFTYRVNDGAVDSNIATVSVDVSEANKPPQITSEPVTEAIQSKPYKYLVVATDPNVGGVLTYVLASAPDGMSIDSSSGLITWSPDTAGAFAVVVEVMDSTGEKATQSFEVVVIASVPPEIISEPVNSVGEEEVYQYDVDASDSDSTELVYSVDYASGVADIEVTSGVLEVESNTLEVSSIRDRNLSCRVSSPVLGSFEPVIKWEWNKGGVLSHPIVAPLQDTNGDGVINTDDDEAILFVEWGSDSGASKVYAVDGKTGADIWTSSIRVGSGSSVAVGDLEGDGIPEVVGVGDGGGLVVYNNEGTVKWTSEFPVTDNQSYDQGAPTIVDLEGDGYAEILLRGSVLNHDGTLRFRHPDQLWHAIIDVAVDLDGDGLKEVLSQDRAFDYQGNELWRIPDGDWARSFVLVNVDDDEFPEIAYVTTRGAQLLDNDGTRLWKHHASRSRNPTPLSAGDLNGDGKPELVGLLDNRLRVLDATTGAEIWSDASVTDGSHMTGAAIFDFEGDGRVEVVYNDSQ